MEITSKHYKKSRIKNFIRTGFRKTLQLGAMVVIGEYMLLKVVTLSLTEQGPIFLYHNVPDQIVSMATSEKPILRVARAYSNMKRNMDFDKIIQSQYPVQIKGNRPDFRTLNLQDKEGAKVGYVVKF
jgi:hypothetical protein